MMPYHPELGAIYPSTDRRRYKCIGYSRAFGTARLRDVRNGYTFTAHDVRIDRFGRILWNRESNGDRE